MAYELRYDPEMAALVGPDIYDSAAQEPDHDTTHGETARPAPPSNDGLHDIRDVQDVHVQDTNSTASSEETYHVREQ